MSENHSETCSHCGESMIFKKVNLLRKKKGKIYSFTDIPAQICPECGERWYASETLKVMDSIVQGEIQYPQHPIEAVEFRFSEDLSSAQ